MMGLALVIFGIAFIAALIPIALQLIGAVIGVIVQLISMAISFALECGARGYDWGRREGPMALWRALSFAARKTGAGLATAYSAVTIFIEELRAGKQSARDPDLELYEWFKEKARVGEEMLRRSQAEREARERREEEARRAQEEARAEQLRREEEVRRAREEAQRRKAQEEAQRRRQEEEKARENARRKAAQPSPYQKACALLGLKSGFTAEDLKRAYRQKMKSAHPDAGGSNAAAAALNAAHTLIKSHHGW